MNELEQFRENARMRDLCAEYSEKWDACQSNKQLFDFCMDSNGMPYLCRSIIEKWGLTPEYIASRFKAFINGRYVSEQNGYDTEVYCLYNGEMIARTTLLAIIGCNITITVPEYHVCKIHIVDSKVRIEGAGVCHVYRHGSCYVSPAPDVRCVLEEGSDE